MGSRVGLWRQGRKAPAPPYKTSHGGESHTLMECKRNKIQTNEWSSGGHPPGRLTPLRIQSGSGRRGTKLIWAGPGKLLLLCVRLGRLTPRRGMRTAWIIVPATGRPTLPLRLRGSAVGSGVVVVVAPVGWFRQRGAPLHWTLGVSKGKHSYRTEEHSDSPPPRIQPCSFVTGKMDTMCHENAPLRMDQSTDLHEEAVCSCPDFHF